MLSKNLCDNYRVQRSCLQRSKQSIAIFNIWENQGPTYLWYTVRNRIIPAIESEQVFDLLEVIAHTNLCAITSKKGRKHVNTNNTRISQQDVQNVQRLTVKANSIYK